jgi:dsRNA-specific ribonuclease
MSVPPLPKIDGDAHIILDVYTHSSLRAHLVDPNDEYGDADRLALLGKEVLDLAITHYWYRKLPLISAEQLMVITPTPFLAKMKFMC